MTREEIVSALEDILCEDKYEPVSQRGIDAIQAAIDILKNDSLFKSVDISSINNVLDIVNKEDDEDA